jgi:hypothetical protein
MASSRELHALTHGVLAHGSVLLGSGAGVMMSIAAVAVAVAAGVEVETAIKAQTGRCLRGYFVERQGEVVLGYLSNDSISRLSLPASVEVCTLVQSWV